MPTPPWHGHLLRGITGVSRKLRNRTRGGYFLCIQRYTSLTACAVPNGKGRDPRYFSSLRGCGFFHGARRAHSTHYWEKSTRLVHWFKYAFRPEPRGTVPQNC